MADFSQSSFIPKQGTAKRRVVNSPRRVYVFTVVSYVVLFATLLAAGLVFLYHTYVNHQLEKETIAFNQAIASFDDTKLQQVLAFDGRLQQAKGRLDTSVSFVSILQVLADTAVETTQIDKVSIKREDDTNYLLTASVGADSFDSTLFQRRMYDQANLVSDVQVGSVEAAVSDTEAGDESDTAKVAPIIFEAKLTIPLSGVLYTGVVAPAGNDAPPVFEASTTTGTSSEPSAADVGE